jgi:hypothetical protein
VRRGGGDAYPFLWFFFDWLCWDEFLDSGRTVSRAQAIPHCISDVLAMATDLCVESPGGDVERLLSETLNIQGEVVARFRNALSRFEPTLRDAPTLLHSVNRHVALPVITCTVLYLIVVSVMALSRMECILPDKL